MKNLILLTFLCYASTAFSRENKDVTTQNQPTRTLNSRAGTCVRGKAEIDLDINNVRARLLMSGDLWWDRNVSRYGVPKLTQQQIQNGERQVTPLFNGAIWISGKVNGNLRMAAIRYSTNGNQFWPGPIKQGQAAINKADCEKFDKFWSVTSDEIKRAQAGLGISKSILEWPGKGNPYLIRNNLFTAEELQDDLAPFYDTDDDCIYEPEQGDLPSIKMASRGNCGKGDFTYADQMIFWVINDVGNDHSGPAATPIGVQVNCLAFAFQSTDQLNNMTFYSYDIFNKSNVDLEETYMSQYMDADLGNYNDDYVGCDTTRSLGFIYNADDFDETTTTQGYLSQVPIFGADFFEGPKKVNGLPIGLSSFVYYVNSSGTPVSDPNTDIEHRNYQEGKNRIGQSLTVSNDCITSGFPSTNFCFYGDPSKAGEWSMCDRAFTPRDLRWLQNSGPFTMKSGKDETITIGLVFVQPPSGSQIACRPVMSYIQEADDKAQRLFDLGFKNSPGPDAPEMKILELPNALNVTLENTTISNNFGEKYNLKNKDVPLSPWNKDTTYIFEGYQIYQIASENAVGNLADLEDNSKAKLLMTMDKKNNISKAVNYALETVNGSLVTKITKELILPNKGIEREFTITEDLFQQEGQAKLANNKTYYYAVVAFAYNNYRNPNPLANEYQKTQVIFSNSLKIFKATPHDKDFWGIKTKANFGQGIDVKRIQGQGHGNYFLDIISSDEQEILKRNSLDELTYVGGRSPILVKVNDPYKLKNASFKVTIKDSSLNPNSEKFYTNSSYWEMEINGSPEKVYSEGNINRNFNQSIYSNISGVLESYGLSVGVSLPDSIAVVARNKRPVYDYIGSSITYTDSSKKWLNFLADANGTKYLDWIRSGSTNDASGKFTSAYNYINNRRVYNDSIETFGKILGGTIAPYCLAANTNIFSSKSADASYESYGPGFKWRRITNDSATMTTWGEGPENNLDSIFSFDLVITKDPDKWTRSLVLETGESRQFNEFNAIKGQIRKSPSVDKDGAPDGDGIGKGWFPGYAINLETGVRVNIYFGENSRFRGKGGANMVWDPDSLKETVLGNPIYGGSQFIYVLNSPYDEGNADRPIFENNFNSTTSTGNNEILNTDVAKIYRKIAWTAFPLLNDKYSFYDANGKYRIPSDIRIKVRVQKPYAYYLGQESIYMFNTQGLQPEKSDSLSKSVFDRMAIVPNPYNAYSVYETGPTNNQIKIVNVPSNSTISIFTTDGILVRKIKFSGADIATSYYGSSSADINYDNSIIWDLRTTSGILVASGTYYINVETPGVGSKVLKLFATMRSADVSNF